MRAYAGRDELRRHRDVTNDLTQAAQNPMRQANTLHPRLRLAANTGVVRFNAIGASNGAVTLTLNGDWSQSTTRTANVATTGAVTVKRN